MSVYDLCPECYEDQDHCTCRFYTWSTDALRKHLDEVTEILDARMRVKPLAAPSVPVCSRKPFPRSALRPYVAPIPAPVPDLGRTV